jgi:endonuclease YncB( thermonuclease family)
MIFKAAAICLALLIGIGATVFLTTNYAEAVSPTAGKRKIRKYKKFSKRWWRAYRNRLRRKKALDARRRALRLRLVRLANGEKSSSRTVSGNAAPNNLSVQIGGLFIVVEGKIKKVFDGDTFSVETKDGRFYLVRMLGADAPDLSREFGETSRKNLSNLLLGKDATVVIRKKDSFGLYVGTVYHGGEDINLKQISAGMAFYFRQNGFEPNAGDRKLYAQAEENARTRAVGLWRKRKSYKFLAIAK